MALTSRSNRLNAFCAVPVTGSSPARAASGISDSERLAGPKSMAPAPAGVLNSLSVSAAKTFGAEDAGSVIVRDDSRIASPA